MFTVLPCNSAHLPFHKHSVHFPRDINSRPVARLVCEPWVWSVVQLVKASGKWHPLLGRQRIAQVPQNIGLRDKSFTGVIRTMGGHQG